MIILTKHFFLKTYLANNPPYELYEIEKEISTLNQEIFLKNIFSRKENNYKKLITLIKPYI